MTMDCTHAFVRTYENVGLVCDDCGRSRFDGEAQDDWGEGEAAGYGSLKEWLAINWPALSEEYGVGQEDWGEAYLDCHRYLELEDSPTSMGVRQRLDRFSQAQGDSDGTSSRE
jgi:hypothetical protein